MVRGKDEELGLILQRVARGERAPLYLVAGDRVLAEPAAVRIAERLAEDADCAVEVHRRPAQLGPLLADLKTYSLFGSAKVVVAVDTAVLADAKAGAELIDEALEACPVSVDEGATLTEPQRRSASRLLQTLRLFRIEAMSGGPGEVIEALPDSVLQGGAGRGRGRGRRQVAEAREQLAGLLEVALQAGIEGWSESDLGDLADIAERGLPEKHALVLAESAAAPHHPLVRRLAEAGCYVAVGEVQAAKGGGWQGLELLAAELEAETSVPIATDALQDLAHRTIQTKQTRGGPAAVSAESTARFAAEYRKLANLIGEGRIGLDLVRNVVEDRGEEDAWKTLDAIGAGRTAEALQRIDRLLAAAEDPVAARLSFFSLLAGFARQLSAVSNLMELLNVPRRAISYAVFKNQIAPRLQAELDGEHPSPVAGLHPYRLFKAFSVACRVPSSSLRDLPSLVLETEQRLKGGSGQPDAALSTLVTELASRIRH